MTHDWRLLNIFWCSLPNNGKVYIFAYKPVTRVANSLKWATTKTQICHKRFIKKAVFLLANEWVRFASFSSRFVINYTAYTHINTDKISFTVISFNLSRQLCRASRWVKAWRRVAAINRPAPCAVPANRKINVSKKLYFLWVHVSWD